jgi:threonine dehydratase
VLRTPLRRSDWLSDIVGSDVFLKLETLQPTFSFKIRGALNAVIGIVEQTGASRPRLVTASAGNHGQALASAARMAGLQLTVYVPATAPRAKKETIRRMGAQLIDCASYDEAESRAKEHAASGSALFISPYSHPDVIAGAGTIALEILEQEPAIDAIVVPVGGGGLVSGIAVATKGAGHHSEVVGVEVEASCPFHQGLAAGRIVQIEVGRTLADGLSGNLDPDTITFDLIRAYVDRMVVVQEDHVRGAVTGVLRNERVVAEGAGATAVAAISGGVLDVKERRTAVILSGANIDAEVLASLI